MNLIKLNDIILDTSSGLNEDNINTFNEYLRGRYVHAINWQYVIPLEELDLNSVVALCGELSKTTNEEEITTILSPYHWLKIDDVQLYIDQSTTSQINDVSKYIAYNEFVPSDLTVDDLKKFRTWLASTILSFKTITDEKTTHMLQYYANGMYDDVISGLTTFGGDTYNITSTTSSTCGCSSSAQTLQQLSDVVLCQPLSVYRTNIYKYMIEVFSDMSWWLEFDPEFLQMFKTYIDNIIKAGFVFGQPSVIDDYVDCGCRIDSDATQQRAIERLNRLSEALSMMIEGSTTGHKNYITTALTDWTTYLYEIMEW